MKRNRLILLQVCLWSLLFISNLWLAYSKHVTIAGKTNLELFARNFIIQAGYLTIPITCFYCSYLFVAPQLFVTKKYLPAFLYAMLTLFGITLLRYLLEYHFFLPFLGFDNYRGHPWPAEDYIENVFFYYFPRYFIYGLMYFFAESWYNNQYLKQELEKERSAAELAFLRSQLNPHFLFNTINDIYSLTYQKSEQAPEALLKLAELLRYMLREGSESFMPLNAETRYLENLIELQLISAKGHACINFNTIGYIGEQKVASLLFVSFVENAFKHGVLNDPIAPVNIHLSAANDSITFHVDNKKNNAKKDKTGGIGLYNVQRRLELIYPGKHKLNITDGNEFYTVNLILETGYENQVLNNR
jgi:two-component system LytT family sensor kinase